MNRVWNDFEKKLDFYIAKKDKYTSENVKFLAQKMEDEIQDYHLKVTRINEVLTLLENKYEVKNSFLKNILSPYSNIFNLDDSEIINRMDYYIELFGSKELLFRLIKNDSWYFVDKSNKGIFYWNDMYYAKKKIDFIMMLFNIDYQSAKLFAINNIYYFNTSENFISDKINKYAEILEVDDEQIKKICLRYPNFFYNTVERLNDKVEGFSKCLNINQNEIKEIIVKYPPLLEKQITQFRNEIRVLKKISNQFIKIFTLYPYIIDCIDYNNLKLYADFSKIVDIEESFKYINDNIGYIEDVIIYTFEFNYYYFLIVKTSDEKYKLLNIGMKYDTSDKLTLENLSYFVFKDWIIFSLDLSSFEKYHIYDRIKEFFMLAGGYDNDL